MSSPADLPGRTSHTQALDELQQRVDRESSSSCGTSSLLRNFVISGRAKLRSFPHRYLRHGFIALSIPAALIAGTVIPVARQQTLAITPVASAYAAQATFSAFNGDAAVADDATADEFVFMGQNTALGAPLYTQYAPISVDVANLRSGPGTSYGRVGQLKQGQTVRLLGRNGDWYQVKTNAGTTGWIHSELVDVASNVAASLATVKVAAAPASSGVRVGVTTDDKVNLRSGPSTGNEVLAKLPKGTQLEVLGQQGSWYKVATARGTVGWVTADFFKLGGAVAAAANQASGPVSASVAANKVNLRKGPNTGFGSFGRMAAGTQVTVLARAGDWYKVRSPRGTVGWVAQDLVNISAAAAKAVPVTKDVPVLPKPAKAAPAPAAPAAAAPTISASNDAASIALQFVGARYVYGGASPRGFDCSGLTTYVYAQLGVRLPHKASLQYNAPGQRVSMGDLAPGDLVFFVRTTPAAGITHVALYVGNGMMVTANTPQTGVQYISIYGKYWQSRFAGGLRVAR